MTLGTPTPPDPYKLFTEVPEAPEYPAREKYQAHLLEQYKLYVEMADRVSQRRQTANSYFLSINSALLAFVGYISSKDPTSTSYLALIGIAGIALSLLWFQIVCSYKNLNTAKYNLIHLIETRLPLNLFGAEWDSMGRGTDPKLYRPLSHVEQWVPWVFVALHGFVIYHALTG